jgi:sec-independent protein translocase protein TatA
MGNTELLLLLFIVLLLFGGRKLPELARSLGQAGREFQKAQNEPINYVNENTHREQDKKSVVIDAAKSLGIEVEGRDINDIAEDIVKATSKVKVS